MGDADQHFDSYRSALGQAHAHALEHFRTLDDQPVGATASKDELRERLRRPLPREGMKASEVVDQLAADMRGGLNLNSSGRFFGWVIGGSVPASVAVDWLATCWDQNAALYSCAPGCSVVEEVCGDWLKELLGLPAAAGVAFVTGCQMAHVTCLSCARHALLQKLGIDVEAVGLSGAPQVRILTAKSRHGSIERAVRLLGFGAASLVDLETDEQNRLAPEPLEAELKASPNQPTIVVLQAGDINTGAFDSFTDLVPLAQRYGAWVHVDGAFGLWANVSATLRHYLEGMALCDSWATDAHKWLNVPYDTGLAFVRDPNVHRAAMSHRANYLTHDADAYDAIDWTPEWSRRCRGLAVYACIRQLGATGIASMIERSCVMASELVHGLSRLPGVVLESAPRLNQGLVRFPFPEGEGGIEADNQFTDRVIDRVRQGGEAFFTGTDWEGRRCMRVSVCNWMTTASDVERAIGAVSKVLRGG